MHLSLIASDLRNAGYAVEIKSNAVFASVNNRSVSSMEIGVVLDAYLEDELIVISSVYGIAKVVVND